MSHNHRHARTLVSRCGHALEPLEPRQLLAAYLPGEDLFDQHRNEWLLHVSLAPPSGAVYENFGAAAAGLGDLDGDGYGDFAISAPGRANTDGSTAVAGAVFLFSGKTGAVMRAFEGGVAGFGASMANIGDANGDGKADLAVGSAAFDATDDGTINRHGRVVVYSGADGSVLLTLDGAGSEDLFGHVVAAVEDADGDGRGDLAVGAPGAGEGRVYIFSGAAGGLVRTLAGENWGDRFGYAVAATDFPLSDAPGAIGDGVLDIVVGRNPVSAIIAGGPGGVYLFDGGSGELRWSVTGNDTGQYFSMGSQVAVVRVGAGPQSAGSLQILVGAIVEGRLYRFSATGASLGFGWGGGTLRTLGDITGDGTDEILDSGAIKHGDLRSVPGPAKYAGGDVLPLGDLDGDGEQDYFRPSSINLPANSVASALSFYTGALFAGRSDSGNVVFSGGGALQMRWVLIDGHLTRMSDLPGVGFDDEIFAVSDTGMIVGKIVATGQRFLVVNGVRTMLSDAIITVSAPAGITPNLNLIAVVGLGNDGTVLLAERTLEGRPGAVWVFKDGVLSYAWHGYAKDVNARGDAAGNLDSKKGVVRWADGTVQVLEGLTDVEAINSRGIILGWGRDPVGMPYGGNPDVHLLTPSIWERGVVTALVGSGHNPISHANYWRIHGLSDSGRALLEFVETRLVGPPRFQWIETWTTPYLFDPWTGTVGLTTLMSHNPKKLLAARMYANGDIVQGNKAIVYRPDRDEIVLAGDASISMAASDSATFMVVPTYNGGSAVLLRVKGLWAAVDTGDLRSALGVEPGQPVVVRSVRTYTNPRTGRMEALIVGERSVAWVRQTTDLIASPYFTIGIPDFEVRTASSDIKLAGETSVFVSVDSRVHLVGADADGELVVLYEVASTGPGSVDGYAWVSTSLSDAVVAQGQTAVPVAGSVASFVLPWGAMNIAYLDAGGNVQAVWWTPGLPNWRIDNLSEIAGAPALHGTLVSFVTPWSGMNVVGTDAGGDLVSLWWAPGMSTWRTDRLVGGTPDQLDAGTLTGLSTPWGGLNIVGLDAQTGKLTAYWWAPGMPAWIVEEFTIENAPADLRLKGRLSSAVARDGRMFIGGLTQDNHIANIWIGAETGLKWAYEDVTMAV